MRPTSRSAIADARTWVTANRDEARYRDSAATAVGRRRAADAGRRAPTAHASSTDMITGVGGGGSAPSPGWLLRAANASCIATLIAMRAAELGVRLEGLEVTVDSESDDAGILGIDASVPSGPLSMRVVRPRGRRRPAAEDRGPRDRRLGRRRTARSAMPSSGPSPSRSRSRSAEATRPRPSRVASSRTMTDRDTAPPAPAPSRRSRPTSASATTSPTARSRRPSSWPSSWAGRCSSRARPASARPSWPRSSPRASARGSSASSATRAWTSTPRSTSGTTRARCSRSGCSRPAARPTGASAHDIFGTDFLIRRPLLQALEVDRRRRPGAADRRDRPRRRGVRGVPARDPVRLPGHGPGDRHDQGGAAAAGDPHLQPDPRGPRRAQAPLPLPLDRLPDRAEGVRDRARARARGARAARPRGRRVRPSPARGGPDQGPGDRRDARLGGRAALARGPRAAARARRRDARRRPQVRGGHPPGPRRHRARLLAEAAASG